MCGTGCVAATPRFDFAHDGESFGGATSYRRKISNLHVFTFDVSIAPVRGSFGSYRGANWIMATMQKGNATKMASDRATCVFRCPRQGRRKSNSRDVRWDKLPVDRVTFLSNERVGFSRFQNQFNYDVTAFGSCSFIFTLHASIFKSLYRVYSKNLQRKYYNLRDQLILVNYL